MKRIYICGKVTGDPNYQKKFLEAEERLHLAGVWPVSPASFISKNTEWLKAMRLAIRELVRCDGIALLPDWKQSKGAKIEERLARDLGLEVKPISQFVRVKPIDNPT
ncbi:hypothetical protein AGMMS50268_37100 [Spirochaetia bacterium]|nr:hypothetical protein AGMMS50268_37100 [Spirochaetia bacterium]